MAPLGRVGHEIVPAETLEFHQLPDAGAENASSHRLVITWAHAQLIEKATEPDLGNKAASIIDRNRGREIIGNGLDEQC